MKKILFLLMFQTLMSVTSFAQATTKVVPATTSTKNVVVVTPIGLTSGIAAASLKNNAYADTAAKNALTVSIIVSTSIEQALNKRVDSLVLAFEAFKKLQEQKFQALPTTKTLSPGRGLQIRVVNDTATLVPQVYWDPVTKTFKQNF